MTGAPKEEYTYRLRGEDLLLYVTRLVLTEDHAISFSKNLHITSLVAEKVNLINSNLSRTSSIVRLLETVHVRPSFFMVRYGTGLVTEGFVTN